MINESQFERSRLRALPAGGHHAEKSPVTAESQTAGAVLLVRPAAFGFHPEAAESNVFAHAPAGGELAGQALREFDTLAERLQGVGIETVVLDDTPEPAKPDAVFPNNWVSFHADGSMVVYPMATAARRLERDHAALESLLASHGFDMKEVIDLSFHERRGHFLEGTGSLVLDRPQRRAFACVSPRTDAAVIADFNDRLDYSTLIFEAHDRSGRPIYHTNVLMSLGSRFALMCSEVVAGEYRDLLTGEIEASGRTLIAVDYDQLRHFGCNLIELKGSSGPVIALSSAARRSYRPQQLRLLESFGALIEVDIPTIEAVGGGSVRCMIAEIHLPRKT
jgi:hypothetical protein